MTFDRSARWALIVATATLLACGLGFRMVVRSADIYLAKQPVQLRQHLTSISRDIGDWKAQGEDRRLTAEVEEELGTEHYLDRVYVRSTGRRDALMVHITYYTGMIDAVPHIPERCIAAAGWVAEALPVTIDLPIDRSRWFDDPDHVNLKTAKPYPKRIFAHPVTARLTEVRMPVGDLQLRTTQFRAADRPDVRIFAGYFFLANGRTASSATGVRGLAFDLTTRSAYYAKIQFSMIAGSETTLDDFITMVGDLESELLPQVMLCLPDWSEVESASSAH